MGLALSCWRLLFRRGSRGDYASAVMSEEEIVVRVSGVTFVPMQPMSNGGESAAAGPQPNYDSATPAIYGQAPPPQPAPSFLSHPPQTDTAAYYPSTSPYRYTAEPFYQSETPGQYATASAAQPQAYGAYPSRQAVLPSLPQGNYELSPVREMPVRQMPRYDSAYCHLLINVLLGRHKVMLESGAASPMQLEIVANLGNRLFEYTTSTSHANARTVYSPADLAVMPDHALVQHCADVLDALDAPISEPRSAVSAAVSRFSRPAL
jgi:hypothetical protein